MPKIMYTLISCILIALTLIVAACATTQTSNDELGKVRLVHLTRPAGGVINAEELPINNPTQSGNVVTGTADLGEQPLARIESADGYAPDSSSLLGETEDIPSDNAVTTQEVTVKEGDTVYSIARANGVTVAELAAINSLDAAFTIQPGQVLTLAGSGSVAGGSGDVTQTDTPSQKQQSTSQNEPTPDPAPIPVTELPSKSTEGLVWSWPLQGKVEVLQGFQASETNKGVDLAGDVGDPVYAASSGTIVYAGNELKGYGNLIIIGHKGDYMSAYGHNSKLLVEADDEVQRGQKIAEVGSVESNRVKLFFQIRHRGEPIDPVSLMPKSR